MTNQINGHKEKIESANREGESTKIILKSQM
jgi:hypothetical protein